MRRNLPRLRRFLTGEFPRACGTARYRGYRPGLTSQHLQRIASFDTSRPGGLQAYLRVAIQNRVRDAYRWRVPIGLSEDCLAEVIDKAPSPFDRAREKEVAGLQQAALSRLRPADRALLVARIEMGYDYKQLARLFGKPTPNAARVAVCRALRRLVHTATAAPAERRSFNRRTRLFW